MNPTISTSPFKARGLQPPRCHRSAGFRRAMTASTLRDIVADGRSPFARNRLDLKAPDELNLVIGGATWSLVMVNHVQPTLLMLLSLVLSATFASAQPTEVTRDQVTLRGTIEAIDLTARTVTIRGDRGKRRHDRRPAVGRALRPTQSRRRRERRRTTTG